MHGRPPIPINKTVSTQAILKLSQPHFRSHFWVGSRKTPFLIAFAWDHATIGDLFGSRLLNSQFSQKIWVDCCHNSYSYKSPLSAPNGERKSRKEKRLKQDPSTWWPLFKVQPGRYTYSLDLYATRRRSHGKTKFPNGWFERITTTMRIINTKFVMDDHPRRWKR